MLTRWMVVNFRADLRGKRAPRVSVSGVRVPPCKNGVPLPERSERVSRDRADVRAEPSGS